MVGGPLDGQQVNVPDHLLTVRFPVPGSINIPGHIQVANYERVGWRGDDPTELWKLSEPTALYQYQGQERA